MLRTSAGHGSFVDPLGEGLMTVAIVWYMVGVIMEMCRPYGVFIAHFGRSEYGARRLGRDLRLLLLALVPTALLVGMASASGRPEFLDGIGRLAFMFGSLALALFMYRVFHLRGGALTDELNREGLVMRMRSLWFNVLVAIPLVLAGLAAAGYFATAGELQGRMFTSGWIVMIVLIVFYVAMRGVMVASRRAAWWQADERRAKYLAQAAASKEAGDVSETLILQNQAPEIDAVAVSQQTRALLRAASFVALLVLLSGIWGGLVPALSVFNGIALWSQVVTTSAGDTVAVITLGQVLLSLLVLLMTFIATRNLPGFLEITVLQRMQIDAGTRYAIATIGRYTIISVGLTTAFNYFGADWSQPKWIVAALGLGLGFGLQEIVANFFSGLIILFERPIRVGDLVSIGATTGTVSRIRIRAVTITDFDNFEVIVPNKSFITGTVQNWSLTSQVTRLLIKVGVALRSDVAQVQRLMLEVAAANHQVLPTPAPSAFFLRFGASALDFEMRVFVGSIDQRLLAQHELHMALDAAFKQAGVEIPFPQRDVHLRSTSKDRTKD
jgi:potassium efflux system protein